MARRRIRNNNSADEIAQAIHRLVDVMQPIQAQPLTVMPPPPVVTMEDFMRHKLTKLKVKAILDDVDAWLREYKKIF